MREIESEVRGFAAVVQSPIKPALQAHMLLGRQYELVGHCWVVAQGILMAEHQTSRVTKVRNFICV